MARKIYAQIDLATNKGITFADPTAAQDAATKAYIDGKIVTEVFAQTSEPSASIVTMWADTTSPGASGGGGVAAGAYWKAWSGTQVQYDAIPSKDVNTLYVITG